MLLCSYTSFSQDDEKFRLQLKSGSFIPAKNFDDSTISQVSQRASRSGGKSFVVIQFESIPSAEERKQLLEEGIELVDYIPNNAYTATVTGSLRSNGLKRAKTRAIIELSAAQKMEPALSRGEIPSWAIKAPGTVDLWASFPKAFSYETISAILKAKGFEIISADFKAYNIIALRIATNRVQELAELPFFDYVQFAPPEPELLNERSTTVAKANVLQSSLSGGRNLLGEGVVVGVGDYINPWQHIDFAGRFINKSPATGSGSSDYHGIHVSGIVGGAGIVREQYTGFAQKSTLILQNTLNIVGYAPTYVQDYGMVITNNSYAVTSGDCASLGVYDLYSRILDQQTFQMPNLQHVFAAGNSGTQDCSPYLPDFGNVYGGPQSAKNLLTVGSTSEYNNSSRGPVKDGRLKPEIVARGQVLSTRPTNTYASDFGTSYSSPAVAGGLALLYQRYRQLHSNANPKSGLMKALLCNGARDLGTAGIDYRYGFGVMNLLRSVTMLEKNDYINASVNSGATNTHSITIPAGSSLAQLKVMLYWNDSAAASMAATALVNDLDLEVTDPAATTHLPQVLNSSPGNVSDPATTGADHVNNIEQVIIDNPASGNYTFSVKGTTIPSGTQHEYFLVFDTIPVSATLTFPAGGERLQTGSTIVVQWDAFGNTANTFTLQYSLDNGTSWGNINSAIAANVRELNWAIPNTPTTPTNQARVKLIHNGTGIESISEPFTILGLPVITLASTANQCEGYIAMNWRPITGATDYEVMMLRNDEMVPIATTIDTFYTFSGLSKDSVYWLSVRPRINGNPGRRAWAVSRQPNTGSCSGTVSDYDLKVDSIISPSSGRKFTSTELSNNSIVSIRIKNLDNAATTGDIPVSYTIGNNPPVVETIVAANIPAGGTHVYSFVTPADLSAIGTYDLKTSVSYANDPVVKNDTLSRTIKQLDNPLVNLATPFLDNIETATDQSYASPQLGLQGLDRYDFTTSGIYGRLRTFVNTGVAYSGTKALTLDADRYNAGGTIDTLTATFNLQGYDAQVDNIRLDFMFKHHSQDYNPANRLWIRGNDQQPWIDAYDLFVNQSAPGIFKKVSGIDLSGLLDQSSQNFSSSFQARWIQGGQSITADNETADGYTFDDISLYKVINDIELLSIDTPIVASCGLNNTVPVKIKIRNTSPDVIASIPVSFKVDNGTTVSESISSINGHTTITYMFTATANLSTTGFHTLKVWCALPSDSYHGNDTVTITIYNSPQITSFPYLQNFESNDGFWHADGTNSSWQYGAPSSTMISKAASGTKAWKTNLTGNYNDQEESYLYSPCFDLTGMTSPTLSFSAALDLEYCGADLCDAAYVEYSNDGKTWSRLGATTQGTNWYNKDYSGNQLWSIQNYTRWHVATIPLPVGSGSLRLRFVMQSDPYVTREGIAIDDIHIYDNLNGIYEGPPYTSTVSQQSNVNGNDWVHFLSGGKLLASVNPNGINLGDIDVQTYNHTGAVRTNTNQYYNNRNITIKPQTVNLPGPDSASVRFYFLDTEVEAQIAATGCAMCSKPSSAYELGVTKYSDTNDAFENGTLGDNTGTNYLFIAPAKITKVPFDKGYYAEFKVKNFSEFWLNNGGPFNDQPLPVELVSFTAKKNASNNVVAEWVTAWEENTARFEIELAKGNDEYRQNHFVKIGEVISAGNSTSQRQYQFTDEEYNKQGVRYYRLKMIDIDGKFTYSIIRAVVFDDEVKWQVYPNPSVGVFNFVYQVNEGEMVNIKLHDINGKLVQQRTMTANAFVQKITIDLSGPNYAPGLYLLEATAGDKKYTFRLLKQ
ncbi:S8 family serine peptidase [Terrimonas pollutisoli]|uniref:S8 family serine peptidase n=1 Tax=Terrimonas pollutisoli TaxID=3034147 RepID=UPI0023EDAA3C|nr:S8 family serine peptidase [Terrimonas sp. H1YJ31]